MVEVTTGVVTNVTPRRAGGTLQTTTTTGTTVLLVDDAGDFEEVFDEPRFLVISDDLTPREYVAVVNDEDAQQSVTLAAAVGVVFEAGSPVTLWDPGSEAVDKRAVEYRAWVRLDDSEKPIPATIPHDKIPLAGAYTLTGASVQIDDGLGEWCVANVHGREAVVDPGKTRTPYLTAWLPADVSIPTNTMTTVSWEQNVRGARVVPGFVPNNVEAYIAVPEDGIYMVAASAAFASNSTGNRYVQLVLADPDGSNQRVERLVTAAPTVGTAIVQAVKTMPLVRGERVIVQVQQASGAALNLLGRIDLTGVELAWVAAR